jgi:hypothetical protein
MRLARQNNPHFEKLRNDDDNKLRLLELLPSPWLPQHGHGSECCLFRFTMTLRGIRPAMVVRPHMHTSTHAF